jgi:glycosyltransferase involved in cell wall biosynthesis
MTMNKTDILFINHSDSHGGAAKACFRLFSFVRDQGFQVKMLVREKISNDPDVIDFREFERKGLSGMIYRLLWKAGNRFRKNKWKKYPEKENIFLNDLSSVSLKKAIESINPGIIHLHFIANRFLNPADLISFRGKIIWTLHDSWAFTGICHFSYNCKAYEKSCGNCPMLHSDFHTDLSHEIWKKKSLIYNRLSLNIVTPSRWLGKCAEASSLLGKFPVQVIPNGINRKIFMETDKKTVREKYGFDSEGKYVIFGAYNADNDRNKGFHLLKEAICSEIKQTDFTLIVFGAEPEKKFDDLQVPVINKGYISSEKELAELYNLADLAVVPSLSENLSFTIMESMSCGTPVVAFDIGGNSDMIQHQVNGYLAKPFETDDLMGGIEWCLKNNDEKSLSLACLNKIRDNFSEEVTGRQYVNLYNK